MPHAPVPHAPFRPAAVRRRVRPGCRIGVVLALAAALACDGGEGAARDAGGMPAGAAPQLRSVVLGGRGFEAIRDVDVGADGDVYVAGSTDSPDFPTTEGAADRTLGQGERPHDAFVARLAPDGTLRWSRLLGGPEYDRAYALELAPDGSLVVAGRAGAGFPVTPGAAQTVFRGGTASRHYGPQDGFVCRLEAADGAVRFCTYFGAADGGIVRDVDVTPDGDVVLAGARTAGAPTPPEWPTPGGAAGVQGAGDGVVARLSGDGARVLWARLLGGSDDDGGTPSVRAAADGSVVVLMHTRSRDLPVTPGAFQPAYGGGGDLFVARLGPDGRTLRLLTYLGGRENEFTETHGLALRADGGIVVAAVTRSPDFPTTPGALQPRYGGDGGRGGGAGTNYAGDGFVAHLAADGRALVAATFLGGARGDGVEGVDLDGAGVAVSGASFSPDLPGAPGARGRSDAFVVRLAPGLDRVLAGGRFGGPGDDWGRAVALAPDGTAWAGGVTWSPVASADAGRPGMPPGRAEAVLLALPAP